MRVDQTSEPLKLFDINRSLKMVGFKKFVVLFAVVMMAHIHELNAGERAHMIFKNIFLNFSKYSYFFSSVITCYTDNSSSQF